VTDHDALLHAIVENPDDDTVRLVFADWLDEHADTFPTPAQARLRAAFIRDDIWAAQLDEFDPIRLRWELIEKPRSEAGSLALGWRPWLPAGATFDRSPLYRRGFAWSLTFDRRDGPLPTPPIESVPLQRIRYHSCCREGVEQLHNSTWRARLTELEFVQGYSGPFDRRRFFSLDGLDRLARLGFHENALTVAAARSLVAAPLFRHLTALTVSGAPIGGAIVGELLRAEPDRLRELHLSNCRVPWTLVTPLLEAPAARSLESFSAGGDRIASPEKFRAIGRATTPPLRALDMSREAPNEAGIEAFLSSPLVLGLRKLALAHCGLNTARTQLLASGVFTGLRVLDLSHNPIGNEGAAALAGSPHLAGLLVLNLRYSQVGDEGVLAILESPLADGLVLLDLTGSPASAETKELVAARMGDRVVL
jgi:uncharacterized protein (TIGR02996 family)